MRFLFLYLHESKKKALQKLFTYVDSLFFMPMQSIRKTRGPGVKAGLNTQPSGPKRPVTVGKKKETQLN